MSRGTQQHIRSLTLFAYRTFTLYGRPFQVRSAKRKVFDFSPLAEVEADVCYNPRRT